MKGEYETISMVLHQCTRSESFSYPYKGFLSLCCSVHRLPHPLYRDKLVVFNSCL